jgi:DNA repair exonuclease SbcCD ATPase subunit
MIQEIYLIKALNIRKEYIKIINGIEEYEKFAKKLLGSISEKSNDLMDLQKKINDKKINSIDIAKDELMKIIINLEEEANGIESVVNGMNRKIEKLKQDESSLYRELKEKYSDVLDTDLKKEIHTYISNNM